MISEIIHNHNFRKIEHVGFIIAKSGCQHKCVSLHCMISKYFLCNLRPGPLVFCKLCVVPKQGHQYWPQVTLKMGSFASSSLWGVGIFPAWELVYIGVGTCVSDVCRFLRSFGDATAGALMGSTFFLVSFFCQKHCHNAFCRLNQMVQAPTQIGASSFFEFRFNVMPCGISVLHKCL